MGTDNKKWIRLIVFVLPILIVLVGINYFADPGNIFHNFSREMSAAMLNGETITVSSNNLDEREVLQYLIEEMPDVIDAMVWGSSLAMCIDEEMVGEDIFFNMAVSAADYYDLLACMALMEINGKHTDKAIITLDSRLFDPDIYMTDGRHDRLMDYSNYMIQLLEKEPYQEGTIDIPTVDADNTVWKKIGQLFSVSYFQWAVEYIGTHGSEVLFAERWQTVDEEVISNKYLPDYSMVYATHMEAISAEEVADIGANYWIESSITPYAHMAEKNKEIIEKLIIYLQSCDTEVELLFIPYAPALWDRFSEERYPMLFELEEYAEEMRTKYGVKIRGSLNPYNMNMENGDFYDARHAKKSALKHKYSFAD